MNRKTFTQELKNELKNLPKSEVDDIIADYEEHFTVGLKKKRKEENIAKSLGKPKDIAKQIKAERAIAKAENEKGAKNLSRAIFATVGMSFFNILIILGPYIGLMGVLISLFAIGIAITATGITITFAGIIAPAIANIDLTAVSIIGSVFVGISLTAFGILFLIGCYYISKGFAKITIAYLKFNTKIIKRKEN